MQNRRQNVTLAIDRELLMAARKLAVERGTTVNGMIREHLALLVRQGDRRRAAREELRIYLSENLTGIGEPALQRDGLHER